MLVMAHEIGCFSQEEEEGACDCDLVIQCLARSRRENYRLIHRYTDGIV